MAANLCVDSKHGATGTELRLDICVKDGSERTWSHEQVGRLPETVGYQAGRGTQWEGSSRGAVWDRRRGVGGYGSVGE